MGWSDFWWDGAGSGRAAEGKSPSGRTTETQTDQLQLHQRVHTTECSSVQTDPTELIEWFGFDAAGHDGGMAEDAAVAGAEQEEAISWFRSGAAKEKAKAKAEADRQEELEGAGEQGRAASDAKRTKLDDG